MDPRTADLPETGLLDHFHRVRAQMTVGSLAMGIWISVLTWRFADHGRIALYLAVHLVLWGLQTLATFERLAPRRRLADGLPTALVPTTALLHLWGGGLVVIDYASTADERFLVWNMVVVFSSIAGMLFSIGPFLLPVQAALIGMCLPSTAVALSRGMWLEAGGMFFFMAIVNGSVVPQIHRTYSELVQLRRQATALADRERRRATTDELTSLPNRRGVSEQHDAERERFERLLYVDLDRFKQVNDQGGHAVGDAVLIVVARRLESATPDGSVVGRIGGDEFIILVPTTAGEVPVIERVEQVLSDPIQVDGKRWTVGASVGATHLAPGRSFETALHEADQRMFATKARRRSEGRVPTQSATSR